MPHAAGGRWVRLFLVLAGLLTGAMLALLPRVAAAQEGDALASVGGGVASYGAGDWLGLGLRLGAVLLIVWLGVLAMRWYMRRMNSGGGGGAGRQLQVLETRALAPNRSLHLVRLGERAILLGATPERITRLLEIDDAEEVDRLVAALSAPGAAPRSFRAIMDGLGGTASRLSAARNARPRAGR